MQIILSVAVITVLVTVIFVVLFFGRQRLSGSLSTSVFTFIAILFTSGLDVGLIMFPLTEFPIYASEEPYSFANPLAISFGFWGFLIWMFYFLTTFYFCAIEPKLKLFEIPTVKLVNNIIIIGTCAFTGFLFLSYLPDYIQGISAPAKYMLVAAVSFAAVLSSTQIHYVKILSVSSTWLFFALITGMLISAGMGLSDLTQSAVYLSEYFTNLHYFTTPLSDYHAFYLFWWFAWSIMIGQFVARFVGDLRVWQLLLALLIFPSIPIALWFSVLYYYYINELALGGLQNWAMIVVGVIFLLNSLDSLTRLYSDNLNWTVEHLGLPRYVATHWCLIFGLVILYQFTPLKIEWVGLLVISIYAVIYALIWRNRKTLIIS